MSGDRRSPGPSREAAVDRDDAGTPLNVGADTVDCRCMNGTGAIRHRHARTAMAAQKALSVSGLAVRVLIGMAAPLVGVWVEVVVGRLDDRQPGDRRKLHQERGGGPPATKYAAHPRHAGKDSARDRALQA